MPVTELRARVNLSYAASADEPMLAYRTAREGLALARHLGYRGQGFYLLGNAAESALRIGDWDWALSELEDALAAMDTDFMALLRRAQIRGLRGEDVKDDVSAADNAMGGLSEVQAPSIVDAVRAELALATGDSAEASRLATRSYSRNLSPDSFALPCAGRAAGWLGDRDGVGQVVRVLAKQPGRVPAAARQEIEAVEAAMDGRTAESLTGFADAFARWRELGLEFEAAMCGLDMVMLLGTSSSEAREISDQSAATFERVGAKPLLERLAEAKAVRRKT